jgi:sugar lactone lactonase YvrE
MKLFRIVFSCTLIAICITPFIHAQENNKLEKRWTSEGFDTPESILMDPEKQILFVSNIGGNNPTEKDGNGFISVLDTDGKIINMKWAEGLNAPKGMTISDGTLYVADIDRIVRINLKTGKIVEKIPVEGSVFLNDMVTLPDGTILISDSKASRYYKLSDEGIEVFIEEDSFSFPNGMCVDEDLVITGVGERIITIKVKEGLWVEFVPETGGVDGLSKVADNLYIFSDWSGRIFLLTPTEIELILDTTEEKINAADFYFDSKKNMLYVPTFFANTVVAYKLKDN